MIGPGRPGGTTAGTPTHDEVTGAIEAGCRFIDDGFDFWEGFADHLQALGYRRTPGGPCICPDRGSHGHLAECGWTRVDR